MFPPRVFTQHILPLYKGCCFCLFKTSKSTKLQTTYGIVLLWFSSAVPPFVMEGATQSMGRNVIRTNLQIIRQNQIPKISYILIYFEACG